MDMGWFNLWIDCFLPGFAARKGLVKIKLQLPNAAGEDAAANGEEESPDAGEAGIPGQMAFPLDKKGDLPNLLQFLSTARRTGRLDLHFSAEDTRGYLYFRGGSIYFASYDGAYTGIDAMGRMANRGRAETIFCIDETIPDNNISLDMGTLLVKMVVLADELIAAGLDRAADAEELPDTPALPSGNVAPDGKTYIPELAIHWEAPARPSIPAPSELLPVSTTGWRPEEPEESGGDAGAPDGTALPDGVTAPPGTVPAAAAEPATPAPPQNQWRIPPNTEILFGIFLLVLTLCTLWWLGFAPASWYRVVNPDDFIEEKSALDVLQRLRLSVRERLSNVRHGLLHEEVISARFKRAEKLYVSAVDCINAGDMNGAFRLLKQTRRAVDQMSSMDAERSNAAKRHEAALSARTAAQQLRAAALNPRDWAEAEAAFTAAEAELQRGRYREAANHWYEAAERYGKAGGLARDRQMMEDARKQFTEEWNSLDGSMIADYTGPILLRIQNLRETAEAEAKAGQHQNAAAFWNQAREQIPAVREAVTQARNLKSFTAAFNSGMGLLKLKKWEDAAAAFRDALAVPGYAAHAGARTGLQDAQVGKILDEAEQLRAAADWTALHDKAREALAIRPELLAAQRLLAEAAENLIPRLAISATAAGQKLTAALVGIDNTVKTVSLPYVVPCEVGRTYTVTVDVPATFATPVAAFRSTFTVRQPGRQVINAQLPVLTAPQPGRPWVADGAGLRLQPVPSGTFRMGTPPGRGKENERPAHEVRFTRPFWAGRTEVTNGQYRRFLRETGYQPGSTGADTVYLRHFQGGSEMSPADDYPVCYVDWKNAAAFCQWLTESEGRAGRLPPGYVYRLPTEAEWEYACRAGSEGDYSRPLDLAGWYADNSSQHNHPAGTKVPNAWGLYDMHGNVWEWCLDWEASYAAADQTDPVPPPSGLFKIIRGGSWNSTNELCRSANRGSLAAGNCNPNLGFRVFLAPELPAPAAGSRP